MTHPLPPITLYRRPRAGLAPMTTAHTPTRSYTILGAGALGGYYGARLHHAGFHVNFLFHRDYPDARRAGLGVDSDEAGDLSIPPDDLRAFGHPEELPPADVALLCLKTTANDALPDLLPHALKPDGVAVVLQNGLDVEHAVARLVGPGRVLGGLCFLCANKTAPARVHHLCYGKIKLGAYDPHNRPGGITDRLRAVAADFNDAGVPTNAVEDLRLARWQKLAWNIPFNGLSVALDATTDRLMRDPHARALVDLLIADVKQAAAAEGRDLDQPFLDALLDDTERMTPYRTSMKIDHDEGRPMEIDAIITAPLRAAEAANCSTPHLRWLHHHLRAIDHRPRP